MPCSNSIASGANPGATMTSRNISDISRAVSRSTGRLNAAIPPKADTGSESSAAWYASATLAPTPMPQGLACLTITTAVSSNSATALTAPSVSPMLLKDSSLPPSCRAAANPHGRAPAAR